MIEGKRYECCHEAGHAVARILIGDTIIRVCVYPNAADGPGERGGTDSKAKERECRCGGYTRNRNEDPFDTRSRIHLEPGCGECMDYLKNRIAALLAGGFATEYHAPQKHRPDDSQFDKRAIDQEFAHHNIDGPERSTIETAGEIRARALVCQEREAILAMTQSLVESNGSLTGMEATQTVRKHFSGDTLYLNL